ncbi:AmmeMemoRadiSam system radical SAM enzyme [Hydrogenobaculum acidophilum]
MFIEASHWKTTEDGKVICELCPDYCKLKEGQVGVCGVRLNQNGKLMSATYGSLVSIALDPVEKKPLFHFLPGHKTLTIATPGCNLHCLGCQNYEISQVKIEESNKSFFENTFVPPKDIVDKALETASKSISYSYSDPIIFYEYMLDIARLAKEKGLKNIMVTAGYITEEPALELMDVIDAFSIDLKFFSEKAYAKYSKGKLEPILSFIKLCLKHEKWIELTTLLVPKYLDEEQIRLIAKFISKELGPHIPWHISRFFPYYKAMDLYPTPEPMIERAYEIGKEEGLYYVYTGNIKSDHENTVCPKCGNIVVERDRYFIKSVELTKGKCSFCSYQIEGVFE